MFVRPWAFIKFYTVFICASHHGHIDLAKIVYIFSDILSTSNILEAKVFQK